MADDFKDLPPEERIKRLKKLEEERKKEIDEARKQIKDSEDEITERIKWVDKVPIPEFAKDDLKDVSGDAKQILKEHRGIKENLDTEDKKEKKSPGKEDSLEETISHEAPSPAMTGPAYGSPQNLHIPTAEYMAQKLTQAPINELQQQAQYLRDVVDRGYDLSAEQKDMAGALYSAANNKIKAGEEGSYAGFTEEVASVAMMTKQTTGRLMDSLYQSNKPAQKDLYKS